MANDLQGKFREGVDRFIKEAELDDSFHEPFRQAVEAAVAAAAAEVRAQGGWQKEASQQTELEKYIEKTEWMRTRDGMLQKNALSEADSKLLHDLLVAAGGGLGGAGLGYGAARLLGLPVGGARSVPTLAGGALGAAAAGGIPVGKALWDKLMQLEIPTSRRSDLQNEGAEILEDILGQPEVRRARDILKSRAEKD